MCIWMTEIDDTQSTETSQPQDLDETWVEVKTAIRRLNHPDTEKTTNQKLFDQSKKINTDPRIKSLSLDNTQAETFRVQVVDLYGYNQDLIKQLTEIISDPIELNYNFQHWTKALGRLNSLIKRLNDTKEGILTEAGFSEKEQEDFSEMLNRLEIQANDYNWLFESIILCRPKNWEEALSNANHLVQLAKDEEEISLGEALGACAKTYAELISSETEL